MKLFWFVLLVFCSALQAGATSDYDVTLKNSSSSISLVLNTQQRIEGFTFCLWFRLFEEKGQRVIVSLEEVNNAVNNSIVSLVYHNPNLIQLQITNQSVNVSVPELFTGEWHHTCAAWNTTNGRWMVMVDGEIQQSCIGLSSYLSLQDSLKVNLGQRNNSSSTQAIDESFSGQMSSFYFWEYEILIRDMRQMFEVSQPEHDTNSTLGWDSFWEKLGPITSTPSRCHKKRNLARKCTTIPAEAHPVVDGNLRSNCYTTPLSKRTTVEIDLNTKVLISEVFISLGSTSAQNVEIELYVPNEGNSVKCGSVEVMISDQSGVIYCNKSLNGTKLIINISLSSRTSIKLCEVLIFGEYDGLLPLAIFPLSNNSQDVTEFKGENFQFQHRQGITFGPGVAGEKYGSSVFGKQSTIEFIVDQDTIASQFSSGSFSMSAWINIHEYTSNALIVGFVKDSGSIQSFGVTQMSLVVSKIVRVVFGSKGNLNSAVTRDKYLNFQKNVWYHLAMTYDGQTQKAKMFRDDEELFTLFQTVTIQTSNQFVIGSRFIGKIACVQVYDQAIYPLEAGRLFYRCLDGQPASPPPIAFFPFSVNQTLQNVMDASTITEVSGALATSNSERTGVLNEPYKAIRFSSDTIRELRVYFSQVFQPRFALSIFSWIRMKSSDSNTFYKHDKLILKIDKNLYGVEFEYETTDRFKYRAKGTTIMLTKRWYFVSFSFTCVKGGSVLLELDGQVEFQEQNIIGVSKNMKMVFGDKIVLGHHLDGKLACVQVYNAWLTNAQRTMVKYRCLDGIEEGIYQMPKITSVNLVSQTQAVVSWLKIDYPIRGLIQGYYVTYSTTNAILRSIVTCNQSSITLKGLQTGVVYNVSVQAFGRKEGPKSQLVNVTIPGASINPPTNITAISAGKSTIRLTWNPSTSPVLGYYVFIQPLDKQTVGNTTIILCSNVTTYELQGLTAMTEYLVKVDAVDAKVIGTTGQDLTVKTDEEAPLNKPYNVRVLNIKYNTPCIYIDWQHRVSSSLRGILRGFTISIWPADGNKSQAKNYSVISKRYYRFYELDVDNNYTAIVYPFTTSEGPGSDPITSRNEEAVKLPPASIFGSVNESCSVIRVKWSHPDRSVTFGLIRDYRVTYYTYKEGPQSAMHVIVQQKSIDLPKYNSSQTYAICVAARSLPDTPFGPCTDTLNVTTNCNTSRTGTGSVKEWSNWTNCSQSCGGGLRNRSRSCLTPPCILNLNESEYCNTNLCPDITLEANFTEEVWNENLVESRSSQFKDFERKIRQNVDIVYQGASGVVKDVKLTKSWQGSVMASVNVTFSSSTADEILRLQEWVDVNGTIGNMPVIPTALYSYTVPGKGPVISSISTITSTSVKVTWTPINSTYYQGYKINYRLSTNNTWQSTNCSSSCHSTAVDGLEPMKTYRFRVQAITEKGNGIVGPAYLTTIPQLASYASPSQVKAAALSSTVITVEWSPIPLDKISGTLLGYKVVCMEEHTGTVTQRTAFSWIDWMLIDNLKKFTWYLIRIVGFSDQGPSASSEVIRVRTLEDVPSAPPSSPVVLDMRDSSTIDVQWSPVPQEHSNGIILGYKLTCRQKTDKDDDDTSNPVFSKIYSLSAATTKYNLRNLNSSTSYIFELLAYTSKGDGAVTKLTGATCNCEREVYSNWRYYPPYVSNDDSGIPAGIFGPVIKDMILTACGECPNGHGRSVLHFSANGKGKPAKKQSQYDVINDIDDVTDVSFPVRGFVGDTTFLKYYSYVSLIESPGTAFLTVRKDESTSRDSALYNSLNDCWPVVILSFSMSLLAGILVWLLDCGSNPEQFSPMFHRGAWEGLWFCYISMTTVGYGDRVPVNILARIVSLIWILTGLSIISICMGLIASSMTLVVTSLEKQAILYGTKVSAVENSTEYRIGLLKNAKMYTYPSLTSSYQALSNGEVEGVLVDAYVAGSLQDITPVNTYVNRIIDSGSFAYGVVLSGKVVRLQKACSEYIQTNKAMISDLIKKNIKPLQNSAKVSNTSEPSANVRPMNQSESNVSVWEYIIYFLVLLGVCICFGLVWEAYLQLKDQKEEKLKQDLERKRACLHQVVKEFYDNFNITLSQLRQKHVEELKIFCKLNKGKRS